MPSAFSVPEKNAEHATDFPAFPINLSEVKRVVTEILNLFGRSSIFEEYTVHDIRHIDDMLTQLDWIIPSQTKSILSPAEWLMIVLSIYFHDIGLIVTPKEFENRDKSGFSDFCDKVLFSGNDGNEYRAKIDALPADKRDKFLYQEFVRANHAGRVKSWIEGTYTTLLGYTQQQYEEMEKLLKPLAKEFRRDLAYVCESHNLDDLEKTSKYPISQPYGNSDEETANVQYCAAILRTVDLLQVTNKRTPSPMFRLISPTDPISQAEWAKQNAVRRIRAKVETDRDGNADPSIQSQTVEVFAAFQEEDGFFGLTSYLKYAEAQLQNTFIIISNAVKLSGRKYSFPWRYIDKSHVGVNGCLPTPFSFDIDQEKVLNLLTGHTLYNNSSVVVRELVQNAIDAVRLQNFNADPGSTNTGKVQVKWDSKKLELSILDNGTGMTQYDIENHLLKVGSSKYQDPKFREANPKFSPISKFGIGVLSSFMVADAVEIITVSEKEDEARKISLRSVHGIFLIKLIGKHSDTDVQALGSHGTSFKLSFRKSARVFDIEEVVRQWIRFPRCSVTVQVDGGPMNEIGHPSPKSALEQWISAPSTPLYNKDKIRVVESTIDGVTLAFAQRYNPHFRDFSLIAVPERSRRPKYGFPEYSPTATCVEGIAVEFDTPGFSGSTIVAIANIVGQNSPKTNVARSLVEGSESKEKAVAAIYKIMFDALSKEAIRLNKEEGYSLTWAVDQVPYLSSIIAGPARVHPDFRAVHHQAFRTLPLFIIEKDDRRQAKSLAEMENIDHFWSVDSELMRSVEKFIKESRSEITAKDLLKTSQGVSGKIPSGALLANSHQINIVKNSYQSEYEPSELVGNITDRRLDIKWSKNDGRWINQEDLAAKLGAQGLQEVSPYLQEYDRERDAGISCAKRGISAENLDEYVAVRSDLRTYILPNTAISDLIAELDDNSTVESMLAQHVYMSAAMRVLVSVSRHAMNAADIDEEADRYFRTLTSRLSSRYIPEVGPLKDALMKVEARWQIFDPLSWSQRDEREIRF